MDRTVSHSTATWPGTIREINDLPLPEKSAIYRTLLPDWVFSKFDIDPVAYTVDDVPVIHTRGPAGSSSVEISVFHKAGVRDPVFYLHLGDTFTAQLTVLLVIVNDPASPRYDIDIDAEGNATQLGTRSRNIPEEERAMQAGLVPGQVRRGLRSFRSAIPLFETFVRRMGHDLFFIEPLFYHNAISFERYGFAYSRGLQRMKAIHQTFLPGGSLHKRLTGENPFRQPHAWQSISGRSWAIHDGILDQPLTDIQMYKRVGKQAGMETFPGARW